MPLVLIIAGPTGSGKSDVAHEICSQMNGVIVSADSVQAYTGVQIGANKPTPAELRRTPHLLVDVADPTVHYNVADWRKDAVRVIRELLGMETDQTATARQERNARAVAEIKHERSQNRPMLPVVVGGTMMYVQWLVQGQPDALKASDTALIKAKQTIGDFQRDDRWDDAKQHVKECGELFHQPVEKLYVNDWYRLRRILEVALTVQEKGEDIDTEKLYSGLREGGLSSLGLDVRCFFLCPDDRMQHAKIIDLRCEQMIERGLISETADLALSGELPDMASKAIGYRQTLDYLGRENPKDDDEDEFVEYLKKFTSATRRYSKQQMQWFRRDEGFVFVPVPLSKDKKDRVQCATDEILRLSRLSRSAYEKELGDSESTSAKSRRKNEAQGKKMKFFMFETQILKAGEQALSKIMFEADSCTNRFQAKKPRVEDTT